MRCPLWSQSRSPSQSQGGTCYVITQTRIIHKGVQDTSGCKNWQNLSIWLNLTVQATFDKCTIPGFGTALWLCQMSPLGEAWRWVLHLCESIFKNKSSLKVK